MEKVKNLVNEVYTKLGPGFSESVYHNAMEVLLRKNNINYETERIVPIVFEEHTIGNLRADLIVEKNLIVELKAVRTLNSSMKTQTEKYIQLTGIPNALLVNFTQSEKVTNCEFVEFLDGGNKFPL
jgi:GxxExxY protein